MRTVRTVTVVPTLPPPLRELRPLAYNLWWSWNPEAEELFSRLDPELWQRTHRNPVLLLGRMDQKRLERFASDDAYLGHLADVGDRFERYMADPGWFGRTFKGRAAHIAYFSAEYGLSDCLPIYSGGLGILSGDHLKSASDLGLPLTAVGLAYSEGYFRQALNADGWQVERYPRNDFSRLPVEPVSVATGGPDGAETPLLVGLDFPQGRVVARVWKVQVGRVALYLLDTNVEQNRPEDRGITSQLYGGDHEQRIQQELVLGVGGMRVLAALGIEPTACHMNEGHSAFLGLERIAQLRARHGLSFDEAWEAASAGNAFTTHTPVPAGNDEFSPDLIDKYLGRYREEQGLSREQLLARGRADPNDPSSRFSMAVLALRLSDRANGVSKLHARVSRAMWSALWPELPVHEVPISAITNGVHTRTWLSAEMTALFRRHLGPRWLDEPADHSVWERVDSIPDVELWRTQRRQREQLVTFVRRHLRAQAEQRGAGPAELAAADDALDPDALTLGFARRFATYKRATLFFHDLERLARILADRERPVQILFAGKAHPRDDGGKELIRKVVQLSRTPELRGKVAFLEDYDMRVARALVGGVDLWLNTPRRPLEASGTSGMKAAANGAINLSVLDGWWCEGFAPESGWAIGRGEEQKDPDRQDEADARDLYELLEREVVPLFYDRDRNGMPRGWLSRMRSSIRRICPVFNTNRMVEEYTRSVYLPASERWLRFSAEGMRDVRTLSAWREEVGRKWGEVRVLRVMPRGASEVQVGAPLEIEAEVHLGALSPADVAVDLCYGPLGGRHDFEEGEVAPMLHKTDLGEGRHLFTGTLRSQDTGEHGYAVRVLPWNENLPHRFKTGLLRWG
jgi:starch phosphorylase